MLDVFTAGVLVGVVAGELGVVEELFESVVGDVVLDDVEEEDEALGVDKVELCDDELESLELVEKVLVETILVELAGELLGV